MTNKVRRVLGLSGGKDSAALAMYMRQKYPELSIEYFFTDTGNELPEVYKYLNNLEGFLGKPIVRLNPRRQFEHYFRNLYGRFLPSARQRWCTIQLKLKPFEDWIEPTLKQGGEVISYVAIRADENRQGYRPTNPAVRAVFPFVEDGIDKKGVLQIIKNSGLGLPDYYKWRSRSGCTFCFFQQKIEWVRLREEHPEAFQEAIGFEKESATAGYSFTWSDGESLEELAKPERIRQIESDYKKRLDRAESRRRPNPLLAGAEDLEVDDVYGVHPEMAVCVTCHK
jgi:3'-phosphoadenosine 5'-phosphosulfate sulfotransferase (PAPS reductase)/FAD synthetase